MNDLETLRPEVISALDALYNYRFNNEGFDAACKAILAELRRLARDNRILELKNAGSLANNLCSDHRDKQAGRPCLVCLLEHAEAELVALKNENAQLRDVLADRDMDREMAAHANKELAALKARIADAPSGVTRVCPYVVCIDVEGDEPYLIAAGKRVRLVVEE